MLKNDCRIKGVVNLVLRDERGRVKQHKTVRNKVTDYGIAHIIGRMMDSNQTIHGTGTGTHTIPRMISHMAIGVGNSGTADAAKTVNRVLQEEKGTRVQVMKDTSQTSDYAGVDFTVAFTSGTDSAGGSFTMAANGSAVLKTLANTANVDKIQAGMSVIAGGTMTGAVTNAIVNTVATSNGVTTITLNTVLNAAPTSGQSVKFQYLVHAGVAGQGWISSLGHPYSAGNTSELGVTRGQVGGYYNTGGTKTDPPFFGDTADAPSGWTQFGTSVDGVFQGTQSGSSIVQDSGTSTEGYQVNENDWNAQSSPASSGTPNAVAGSKRTGNRIVFVATFKASNPVDSNTTVVEAGMFNKMTKHVSSGITAATYASINGADGSNITTTGGQTVAEYKAGSPKGGDLDQTMLCRTTFNVVNKASNDTLQITWSVQLSDSTS